MINLYKAHILSVIEYSTPAISHTSATTLAPLDKIQARLLCELGLSPEEALIDYQFAPFHSRRNIHRQVYPRTQIPKLHITKEECLCVCSCKYTLACV